MVLRTLRNPEQPLSLGAQKQKLPLAILAAVLGPLACLAAALDSLVYLAAVLGPSLFNLT